MSIQKWASTFLLTLLSFTAAAEKTPTISQIQLVELLSQPDNTTYVVLDVRTPREFNAGHIEGAINISHNTISNNLAILDKYKNKTVVVHCRSGMRALSAEKVLKKNGFSNLRHLEGDMLGWVKAKLPLVK